LTASNGGVVWSNASQFQILAGTATAGQFLLSGATATPSWSNTVPNVVTLSNTTNSTSLATGALQVSGGAAITKDVWIGGSGINTGLVIGNVAGTTGYSGIQNSALALGATNNYAIVQNTSGQTNVSAASGQSLLLAVGGVTVQNLTGAAATINLPTSITSTANATSLSTGSLVSSGGAAFAKDVWIGGSGTNTGLILGNVLNTASYFGIQNSALATNTNTNFAIAQSTAGQTTMNAASGQSLRLAIADTEVVSVISTIMSITPPLTLISATNTTGIGTGALIVNGGASIGKDLFVNGSGTGTSLIMGNTAATTNLATIQNGALSTASSANYAFGQDTSGVTNINSNSAIRLLSGGSTTLFSIGAATGTFTVPLLITGTATVGPQGSGFVFGSSSGTGTAFSAGYNYSLQTNGTIVAPNFFALSDARLKKDVKDVKDALTLLTRLRPVRYTYRHDGYGRPDKLGFLAQDLEKVVPTCVRRLPQAVRGVQDCLTVDHAELIPILVKSVQELLTRLEKLEKK
jgi:hypothetical protein